MAGAVIQSGLVAADLLQLDEAPLPSVGSYVLALTSGKGIKWGDSEPTVCCAAQNAEVIWKQHQIFGVSRAGDLILSDAAGSHCPLGGRPMSSALDHGALQQLDASDLQPGSRVLVQLPATGAAAQEVSTSRICLRGREKKCSTTG